MNKIKKLTIFFLILYLMLACSMEMACSYTDKRGEVLIGDCFIAGNQEIIARPAQEIFHNRQDFLSDKEYLAIGFSDDTGTTICGHQLAMADIYQDSQQKACHTETGQYFANWNYISFVNVGGEQIGADLSAGHPLKAKRPIGSSWIYPSMVMIDKEIWKAYKDRFGEADGPAYGDNGNNITREGPGNATMAGMFNDTQNITSNKTNTILYSIIDPWWDLNPASRNNMTIGNFIKSIDRECCYNMPNLERMYWNSHITRMDMAFIGQMSHPDWIAPVKNPFDIIPHSNQSKVNREAMNMTRQGAHIMRKLWDI
jgi:hypothetical protein